MTNHGLSLYVISRLAKRYQPELVIGACTGFLDVGESEVAREGV
jgi:hypothetical protein